MAHYFSQKQNSPLNPFPIKIKLKNFEFELMSASGVFSKKKIDKGTKLLIENAVIKKNQTVLDIGCGIGVVGISILKMYDVNVLMTDINERAVMMAKHNIKSKKLSNINAKKSDLYKNIDKKFDVILSNPPQTAGKEVCFNIIKGAGEYLNDGGLFQLVARHKKGGAVLEKKMKEVFGNTAQIAKGSGYRVYLSEKK